MLPANFCYVIYSCSNKFPVWVGALHEDTDHDCEKMLAKKTRCAQLSENVSARHQPRLAMPQNIFFKNGLERNLEDYLSLSG